MTRTWRESKKHKARLWSITIILNLLPRFLYQSDDTNFALHFAKNQPDDWKGREDCVHFTPETGTRRSDLYPFNDASCNAKNWAIFVCQAPRLPKHPIPIEMCPHGYKLLNRKCYKLHHETKSYREAQGTCANEGGTLIEPRSQIDLDLIESEWGQLKKQ